MDPHRFDAISRFFARTRRNQRRATAEDIATPASVDTNTVGPEMLFVQSFESGSIAPIAGEDGRYTVRLEHGLGQTIYFSDRPDRIVGSSPTQRFLDGLGFTPDNPPNAAILTDNGNGETTLAVVELFDPSYDVASATVTYEMAMLAHWEDTTELGFAETPVDLSELGASFGTTHLFIDDCPSGEISCTSMSERRLIGRLETSMFGGYCYSPYADSCLPCSPWHDSISSAEEHWTEACNAIFPDCNDDCVPSGVFKLEPSSD